MRRRPQGREYIPLDPSQQDKSLNQIAEITIKKISSLQDSEDLRKSTFDEEKNIDESLNEIAETLKDLNSKEEELRKCVMIGFIILLLVLLLLFILYHR